LAININSSFLLADGYNKSEFAVKTTFDS